MPRENWESAAAKQTLIDTTTATEAFNRAIVTVKCADDTNIGSWCSVHIVVTVNGEEKDIELKGTGTGNNGESCTIELSGVSVLENDTYKIEAYTDSYMDGYSGDYVYKVSMSDFSYLEDNSNSEVALVPRADWNSPAAKQTLIDTTTATEAFNKAIVTVKCADDTNIGSWCSVHIIVTVNGKEEDIELKGTGTGNNGESCTIELSGVSVLENDNYKIEAYTDSYMGNYSGDYVYKVSIGSFSYADSGSDDTNDDSDNILTEVHTSADKEPKKLAEIIPETTAESEYNKATVTVECASDVSFNEYASLCVVITVNGIETKIEQKGIGEWTLGWKGTYDITDEFPVIKVGDTYKVEAYTDSWDEHVESYVFKVGIALSCEKTDDNDVPKPEKVKTEISSVKMAFTYEKTGQNTAESLKVCGTEISGFNGDGTYEVEIAEAAWSTWDKTGFYNVGFVASDTEYVLKDIILTVNGVHEFVLGETRTSEYNEKEEQYKVDFPNCWSPYNEGDILFTSKDGKATIVFGGNNVVMSLYVESATTSTPTPAPTKKPSRPIYVVPTATPTVEPTASPTAEPTATPTATPTVAPTAVPTVKPTEIPTVAPTDVPTIVPTVAPTIEPTEAPTVKPSEVPATPTKAPAATSEIKKGDKVTVSGQKYVVTNASKKTVAYAAPKNSKKTTVSVPATVKVTVKGKKVTYKVTSIQEKAFKGNKKLKKITVSKNITSIGKDAFKNCGKLKTIVIKSSSITKVGKDALKGTAKNLVIKVPAKKVSAYKKLFKNKGNNSVTIKKA